MNTRIARIGTQFDPVVARAGSSPPFLTVAIPQYNRREYLEVALPTIFEQTLDVFDILVSDDGSSDDTNTVIPLMLEQSGRPFQYYAQRRNLGYDRNVRFCLSAARGTYVLMLGNDDALVARDTLAKVADALKELGDPEVAITNYEDWQSGQVTRRAYGTRIIGHGPWSAAQHFRAFSFTSGLIYKRSEAARHETDKWDRSIYYQIYLACRIMASGGRLAGIDESVVRDHIRLKGELFSGTYRVKYKDAPFSIKWKHTGLDSVVRVAVDAIAPCVDEPKRSSLIKNIWKQILLITYPFWVLEYRSIANWGIGFGVARDLWPGHRLREYPLKLRHRAYLWLLYLAVTPAALIIPPMLFNKVRHGLADYLRRRRQGKMAVAACEASGY
jgi:glycosyltransferase involved in cell wall biosynthesis